MSLFVLDTDTISLFDLGHGLVVSRVLACERDEIATTVITVEEVVSGWFAAIRSAKGPSAVAKAYQRLGESVSLLGSWHILPYTEAAIARFNGLKGMKLNVGNQDLRIAAIVLENNATLVTRNATDFCRVPGLTFENWAD